MNSLHRILWMLFELATKFVGRKIRPPISTPRQLGLLKNGFCFDGGTQVSLKVGEKEPRNASVI